MDRRLIYMCYENKSQRWRWHVLMYQLTYVINYHSGCWLFRYQTFRPGTFRYRHFGTRHFGTRDISVPSRKWDISVLRHFGTWDISVHRHFGPWDISVRGHFGTRDISVLRHFGTRDISVPETFRYQAMTLLLHLKHFVFENLIGHQQNHLYEKKLH